MTEEKSTKGKTILVKREYPVGSGNVIEMPKSLADSLDRIENFKAKVAMEAALPDDLKKFYKALQAFNRKVSQEIAIPGNLPDNVKEAIVRIATSIRDCMTALIQGLS